MDLEKFYCHNATQATAQISSSTSDCETHFSQEYLESNQTSTGFDCRQMIPKSIGNKDVNQWGANIAASFAGTGGGSSTSGYCSSSGSSLSGNYINVIPMGTLQYHRRKLSPEDYPSRLCYNSTDYRCRDDLYSSNVTGRLNSTLPSPLLSSQFQNQHPHQHVDQHLHLQQNQHQSSQQSTRQHYYSHQRQQQHRHHHHSYSTNYPVGNLQMQHHSTCSPNAAVNQIDEELNCGFVANNSRVVACTQTNPSNTTSSNHEQFIPSASVPLNNITAVSPIMYTVHRVVTTAHIQTEVGNTFTSSSSVSSVVSAVCNDVNNVGKNMMPISSNGSCFVSNSLANDVSGVIGDSDNSILSSSGLAGDLENVANNCSLTGTNTNAGYLPSQSKSTSSSEIQHSETKMANSDFISSSPKISFVNDSITNLPLSSVPRPLQNMIPTCVYLMSRVAVHMEIEGTAQCPTQVMLAAALGCEELGIANKLLAQSIFGLWMTSSLLEIQLKSHHRPYIVRVAWSTLLEKYSHGNPIEKQTDEPMVMLKRNVFFSKRDEEKIKDHRILELLYEEAKCNVLTGRYIMESVHFLMLGGIQARIELGPFNSHTHTVRFFRENQVRFLPQHVAKNSSWSWFPISRRNSAEVRLLEQFKRVPQTATARKLMRKYLEFCWALPFYGAAFFHGQVEQPVHGLMSLVSHKDIEVLIAINERGIYVIDPFENTLLLGLRYEDLSWDFAKPSSNDDPDCQTCIFIQFDVVENGMQMSKLMQIFSKQAPLIDALISHFTEQIKNGKLEENTSNQFHDEPNPIQNSGCGVLCNKLSRLTLATFDEEGRCIGQMGSLSISY